MSLFAEIVNPSFVRAVTTLVIDGVTAGSQEWATHNWYPNKGVVGIIVSDEAFGPEGQMYVLQCGERLFVPILPKGIKFISEIDFRTRVQNNLKIGEDKHNLNSNAFANDFMNYLDSLLK